MRECSSVRREGGREGSIGMRRGGVDRGCCGDWSGTSVHYILQCLHAFLTLP